MLYDRKYDLDEPRRVLLQAANEIRRRGWCRHTWEDDNGRVCVHGAINAAITGIPTAFSAESHERAAAILADYLRAQGVAPGRVVGSYGCALWNNAPERIEKDVVDALEAAAWKK